MLILAHRGLHTAGHPENTLAAFDAAAQLGVDGFETDIRLSRDGEAVLFHDRLVRRSASDSREVAALTRDELSAAVGYPVPTLQQALDRFPDRLWNLEIKTPAALARTLAVVGAAARSQAGRRFLVTSFWHPLVDPFTGLPGVECGLLFASRPATFEALSVHFPHDGRIWSAVWHWEVVDPGLLDQTAALGIRNYVYGVETPAEHEQCLSLPLVGVITDRPELLLDRG
jgi:glycerophosphoryl diester phosphodiesterase